LNVLLIQLPVPQVSFGRHTGNIPPAAAWLSPAVRDSTQATVLILPGITATRLGDAALAGQISSMAPSVMGFIVYC
jgi:hypothetical protein